MLKQKLLKRIRTSGPLSVADYMAECLFHPEHGYYTRRQPFGADGDFITAPDISQMFGELTALWLVETWSAMGKPADFCLCEIGPGRATWMRDILRTAHKADPDFVAAAKIHLIEKSPRLIDVQKTALSEHEGQIKWVSKIDDLPALPTLLIANELFDALPTRQYVKTTNKWAERVVSEQNGELIFTIGTGTIDADTLPLSANGAEESSIFEYAPAREALAQEIASHIAEHKGAALFIDYGHVKSGLGDTLQAVRAHKQENVFANPGDADLTSHVDFETLNIAAKTGGSSIFPIITQAEFLLGLGLIERAGLLGMGKDQATQQAINDAVNRLAGNGANQMGDLFKAMCITSTGLVPPAPFGQPNATNDIQ
ncbi:class I SAM-dependent methyltransferase [Ahrensia sp. 13_GOM-1096m]|uniref:class I SAM-dependent methyltransferase n=1 Tax=Ahrensia sp. 13_GOM-1096m TaxID=1380380 RepID=UPI000551D5E4|nr:class I SAM-dependent methyltransferase [Ahrensia sp. 13_GOM-1096m]